METILKEGLLLSKQASSDTGFSMSVVLGNGKLHFSMSVPNEYPLLLTNEVNEKIRAHDKLPQWALDEIKKLFLLHQREYRGGSMIAVSSVGYDQIVDVLEKCKIEPDIYFDFEPDDWWKAMDPELIREYEEDMSARIIGAYLKSVLILDALANIDEPGSAEIISSYDPIYGIRALTIDDKGCISPFDIPPQHIIPL